MKYSKLDLGTMEAIINKLGGMEGARKFLREDTEKCVEPISFRIGRWLLGNGYHPATWSGHAESVSNTTHIGVLCGVVPKPGKWFHLTRNVERRDQICTFIAKDNQYKLEVYGRDRIREVERISRDLMREFNINVTVVLESETVRKEEFLEDCYD